MRNIRIEEVVRILANCGSKRVAIIAPDVREVKLAYDRFVMHPIFATCNKDITRRTIEFFGHTIEFLTPAQAQKSSAGFFFVEFPDMIPEPDLANFPIDASTSGEFI